MPQPVLTIELQPGSLKAFVVSNASKIKACGIFPWPDKGIKAVSYTHLRAHETVLDLVCRLLLEKKKN